MVHYFLLLDIQVSDQPNEKAVLTSVCFASFQVEILICYIFIPLRHLCFAAVFKVLVMIRLLCAHCCMDHTKGEAKVFRVREAASFSGAKSCVNVIDYVYPSLCERRKL